MNQTDVHNQLQTAHIELDRHPVQVDVAATVADVLAQMCQLGDRVGLGERGAPVQASYVLVMDAGRLVGIFTERDVLRLTVQGIDLKSLRIVDCMTRDLITMGIDEICNPLSVLAVLKQHHIRHLPVLDGEGQLVGVATAETLRQSMRSRDFLRLRRVEEVMARQMVTATAQETVISLVQRMVERRVSCVVIVESGAGEGQRPIGIVTERDVVQMRNLELNLERLTAAAVMSTPLEWITPEQSLWDIQQAMERLRVRRLVVVEQDCLVGIVTQTSILNALDPVEMYRTIELLQAELDQLKHERLAMLLQQNADLQDQVLFAEQRFQAIFNNTFQFIGLMTPDGTLIEANQAALDFGGVTRDQVLHRPVWETYWWTISPETQEQVRQATAQAAQGEFVRYEVDVLGARGRIVTIDFSLRPLRDEHGNVVLLLPEGRDITELKQTQQALEFQVKFDRLVASLSNQFIQITSEALDEAITAALRSIGEFTQVDTCYIFRYDEQQLLHSMTHEWVSPSIESSQQRCQDLPLAMFPWATEQLQRGEIVHIPNTETLPLAAAVDQRSLQQFGVRSTLSLPLKQHNRVIGLVGFACLQQHRDWTDDNVQLLKSFADVLANALQRQQADIELRRSYQRYDNLVNRVPVGVYKFCMHVDGEMRFEYVSARWCDMNQLDAAAVLQDASLAFGQIHPDELDNFQQLNQQAGSTLQPFVWEGQMLIDGQVYWRHIESSPTQRDNGDIVWDGIQYDITEAVEAKQAQERLLAEAIAARTDVQQSEQRYASLAAAAPVGIFRTDADGNCLYVNDRWSQIAGMSRSDALGEGWVNGLHPDDREQISSEWYRAAQENRSFKLEYRFQRADGSVSWVFGQAVAERDATGQIISYVGTITDITDRKQAEQDLQTSTDRLKEAQQIAHLGSWELDLSTNTLLWSDEIYRIFEIDPQDFVATYEAFLETVHPDDRDAVDHAYTNSLITRQPYAIVHRLLMADGRIKYVQEQCQTSYDEAGQALRSLGTVQDVTNLKVTEQALKRQRDFNQLIAEITSRFVDVEATALDAEIDRSLQLIGEMMAIDITYLFQWDADGLTMRMTHEWNQSDQPPQMPLAQNIPLAAFPWSIAQLKQRQPLYVRSVADLPAEAAIDQASWRPFNVIGVLGVPLIQRSAVVGFVGFGSFSQPLTCEAETMRLLQVLAQTITNAQVRAQDERQLYESEERLRLALMAADQGLYDLNLQTGDAIVSPEYATMLGYDPAIFQETNARWIERLHPDDREPVAQVYRDYVAGLIPEYQVEFRQRTRSSDWKWILSLGKIVAWDESGNPLRMLGTHTDIHDRKLAELQLTFQNSMLARIAQADPLAETLDALVRGSEAQMSSGMGSILLCDREGRVHYGAAPHLPDTYNQAIEGLMTGEGKGSCGTAAFRRELVIVADIATDPLWQDYAALALAHGLRACWSLPVLASDGTVLATFAVYHHDIHEPGPQEILVIQRMADLTKIAIESEQSRQALRQLNQELEIKVIERTAALQESEAQLRDLFDNATDLIQSIAPDGRILFVNQAWKTALGYKESEFKELSIYQVIHPDEVEHYRLVMQRLFDGEECEGIETRFVTKAGQEIILEGNVNCRRQDGQAVSTRGIFRDVTERRQAEVQLKRQLAAIEAAVDGIAILQGDQYIYVNSSHLSLFGYSCSEDLIGKSWQCLYSPEEILRFEQEVFPALGTHGRWEGEAVARRKDGTTFVEGLSLTLSEDGLLICVCRDITERKQAEEQLRKSDAHLKSAQRIAQLGSWEFDVQKEQITWSKEVFTIFGLDPIAGPPANFEALQQCFHPDDREPHAETVRTTLTTGQSYDREFRICRPDGALVYIQVKGEVIFNASGQPYQMLGTLLNITERKQAEQDLQRLNADLQRSNQELEQFAYIASHDLQEPLRAISGYTQLLKQEYVEALSAPMAQEYMGFVMDGAQRMRLLIQDLLAYSRVGSRPLNLSPTDSNEVLADVLSDLQTAIAETNAIITADPLPILPVDRIQLMQIFQNLISNALKFRHEDPPHIHIRAVRRIESKFGAQVSSTEQESSWLFSVQDNGIGIKPQYLVRVFDIFRRLHSQRKFPGTGIGLALCKKAVERHGGEIWAESEPEMGTTFYFTLPTVPRQ